MGLLGGTDDPPRGFQQGRHPGKGGGLRRVSWYCGRPAGAVAAPGSCIKDAEAPGPRAMPPTRRQILIPSCKMPRDGVGAREK